MAVLRSEGKFRINFSVGLLVFLFVTYSTAQEPASQPSATFRTTANLVVLDVVVTDRSGNSVTNLTQEDFTVLEDAVVQNIASFQSPPKQVPTLPASATVKNKQPRPASEADSVSPQALTVIVLDELNSEVGDQAYARSAIEKFLRKRGTHLAGPTSLMLLGQKRIELLHDYTQDARALVASMHSRHAELPFGLMTSGFSGAAERLSKTLWALQQIASANNHFAGRKNVIWVGPGFASINGRSLDPSDRPRFAGSITESAELLRQARVSVYTVNPRGLEGSPAMYAATAGDFLATGTQDQATGDLVFESIAPETGGRIFRLRNDVDLAIGQSIDDGSSYYSFSYSPTNHAWNGKYRRIQIAVRGQGLQARSRKGYYGLAETPLNDFQIHTVLSRAVMNPLSYRALDVEAKAKSAGTGKGRFMIRVDRHDLQWETLPDGSRRCEVTVVIASVGPEDRVYSHKVTELESVIDGKRFEEAWSKPLTFDLVSGLPPKARYVRIVVRDAHNDRIGSADLPRDSLPFR